MHLHFPSLILVPDTSFRPADIAAPSSGKRGSPPSMLLQYMREEFPEVPIEPIARKYWNDRAGSFFPSSTEYVIFSCYLARIGAELIAQLGVDDEDLPATLVAASQKLVYVSCFTFNVHAYTSAQGIMLFPRCAPF